jgi:hypothetical protein
MIAVLSVMGGLESSQDLWDLGWFGLVMSGWEIAVDNFDWVVNPLMKR